LTNAAAVLLARGIQPDDIESMSLPRLEFWLGVCNVISEAEQKANSP
jgi:hypothetical protein